MIGLGKKGNKGRAADLNNCGSTPKYPRQGLESDAPAIDGSVEGRNSKISLSRLAH